MRNWIRYLVVGFIMFHMSLSNSNEIILDVYHEGGRTMKLIGKLKEDVEKAENKEEAKKIIEKAGMSLRTKRWIR